MSPYSPIQSNSQLRLLLAAVMALAIHFGLMNVEFDPEPALAPTVALPFSVSVRLVQRNMDQKSGEQQEKSPPAKPSAEAQPTVVVKHLKPDMKKMSGLEEEKPERPQLGPQAEETAGKPGDDISPAGLEPLENSTTETLSESGEASEPRQTVKSIPATTDGNADNGALPGTLRRAYPHYKLNAPPEYPKLARMRGREGTVVLQVLVNSNGRVDDLEIESSSGFATLDRSAAAAVRKWQFEPGRQGEEKIAMWVRVPVVFRLKK